MQKSSKELELAKWLLEAKGNRILAKEKVAKGMLEVATVNPSQTLK